ncbi:MAG TPA: hypothetical protein VK524_19415 [Polyangiaceae bacterium]|nr:hypothetical protein [Polyangiaceae bacterium]
MTLFTTRVAAAATLLALCPACRKGDADAARSAAANGSTNADAAAARPLDRLSPDELAAGSALAFGFPMPRRMTINATFRDAVHASGNVTPQALTQYVRDRVIVAHVELAATRTIFPRAKIKGGAPERLYQFDVVSEGPQTLLVIRDVTPPPVVQGLSEAERWRRAGMTPDGKPLNEKQLQ